MDDLVDENENYQVEEGREHSPLVVVEKSYPALEAVFALKQLQNLSIDPAIHQLDLSFVDNLEELEEKNVSADLLILLDFWNRVSQEYTVCHLDMFKDVEINNVTLWNETVKKAIEEREEVRITKQWRNGL